MKNTSWKKRILGDEDVAFISSGGTPSRIRPEYFNGDIKWVKSGDLNDSHITTTEESISRLGLEKSAARIVPENSVLIALYGATVGKTGLLKIKAATNQAVCAIRPAPEVFNAQFLQFLLMHIRPQLLNERSGGAQPNISQATIRNLELPQPEIPEQEKIAALLWQIQHAIEAEIKLIATVRELKRSAMCQLFTCGLRKEEKHDTELGPLPKSWSAVPLGSYGRIGNGSTPLKSNPSYWTSGTIPWLTSAKVYDVTVTKADQFVTPLAVVECHLPSVRPGSVLIAITGQGKTLGNAAVTAIETCVSQHIAFVTVNDNSANPHFIRLFLESRYAELRGVGLGGGSTKGALTCGFLKTFLVPRPERKEQDEIASALMTIEAKISVHERKRAALSDLFQTLLNQLMTAQIRVDKLDIDTNEVTT